MKLLCTADVHLGRVPSRLPSRLPFRTEDLGPRAAWQALIEDCLREGAQALLLAGDLVDDARDLFEAYADLERGVRRLQRSGTEVIAVAGNHDALVLTRLADAVPGLRLLGRGGRWAAHQLGSGADAVRIVGWSFPAEHAAGTPIGQELYELLAQPAPATTLGLVHGDLDAAGSRYAPLSRTALTATGVDAWLLGHVHSPAAFDQGDRVGYLGSLAATDPGEAGPRHAWLLEVAYGSLDFQPRSLAPLRYDAMDLDLTGSGVEEAPGRLIAAVRERLDLLSADDALLAVALEVRLRGQVERPLAVAEALRQSEVEALTVEADGRVAFVHEVTSLLEPPLELERLAQGSDPVGVAARTLAVLRGPSSAQRDALIRAARGRFESVRARTAFAMTGPRDESEDAIVDRLEAATLRLLATLTSQRQERAP